MITTDPVIKSTIRYFCTVMIFSTASNLNKSRLFHDNFARCTIARIRFKKTKNQRLLVRNKRLLVRKSKSIYLNSALRIQIHAHMFLRIQMCTPKFTLIICVRTRDDLIRKKNTSRSKTLKLIFICLCVCR